MNETEPAKQVCGRPKLAVFFFVHVVHTQRDKSVTSAVTACIFTIFKLILHNTMSSTEDTSLNKLAGHPPAVKAGGMRITQHKVPHAKDTTKEPANEDYTGLGGPNPVPSNPISIAGAPNRGNADYTPEAAKVAHSPKPPAHINLNIKPNIQQPRK